MSPWWKIWVQYCWTCRTHDKWSIKCWFDVCSCYGNFIVQQFECYFFISVYLAMLLHTWLCYYLVIYITNVITGDDLQSFKVGKYIKLSDWSIDRLIGQLDDWLIDCILCCFSPSEGTHQDNWNAEQKISGMPYLIFCDFVIMLTAKRINVLWFWKDLCLHILFAVVY